MIECMESRKSGRSAALSMREVMRAIFTDTDDVQARNVTLPGERSIPGYIRRAAHV